MSLKFVWKIPIDVPPDKLWRYISDTNRVNQYAGLPEFTFKYIPEPDGGSRQIGETRYMGLRLQWEENPFEWIEGQHFEILREYFNGPIREFRTSVTLHPANGGSIVEQVMICEPRWPFVSPVIYWEVGFVSQRRFRAAYQKIEKFLKGNSETPFVPVPRQAVPPGRLDVIREKLALAGGRQWLPRLIDALETSADEDLDSMRPFVFADRWKADRRDVLRLFLHASQAGLLNLSWDVICPGCRGAPERHAALRNMRQEAHCPACNIKYTADFAESVEVTFRPNPAIRTLNIVRYCSGGPMNAPHVVAQQRIPARGSRTVQMTLRPWKYHVRSAKLEVETFLRIETSAPDASATISVHRPTLEPETLDLAPDISLTIENTDDKMITVAIERVAGHEQAATAAAVIAMSEFRTLFSEEVLSPDNPISVGAVTLMFTDLRASTSLYEQIGEAPAYGLVRRHFDLVRAGIGACDGAVVKTIGDAVMAAFLDPANAMRAAVAIHQSINRDNAERGGPFLSLKMGLHYGPCIAVNQNDILDYFGTTVNIAARIEKESRGGDIMLTEEVWKDPRVQEILEKTPHRYEECSVMLRGLSGEKKAHRVIFS